MVFVELLFVGTGFIEVLFVSIVLVEVFFVGIVLVSFIFSLHLTTELPMIFPKYLPFLKIHGTGFKK